MNNSLKCNWIIVLLVIMSACTFGNGSNMSPVEVVGPAADSETETEPNSDIVSETVVTVDTVDTDEPFCFVCRGDGREENFDSCPVEVTTDNVEELYRLYDVIPIENTDLYKVEPDRLYTTSAYFTRLIRFEDGKQVAAITFYGWNARYIFVQEGGKYMVGLNSLATTAGFNKSTFTCKSVLLDKSLRVIKEREFRYPEQRDAYYAYAYFDTIYPRKGGYDFVVINAGFDASDYYEYKGHLSKDNVVTESSKRNVIIGK